MRATLASIPECDPRVTPPSIQDEQRGRLEMNVSMRYALALGMALLGGDARAQTRAEAKDFIGDAKVLEWNAIAVDTIGAQAPFPSARFMATTQVAVFEAINAITGEYEPYLATITAPLGASAEAAAIAAAHAVLEGFFPAASAELDQKRADSLATIADGPAKTDGIAAGEAAAVALLAERANDGSTPPQFYQPAGRDPGLWQLTPGCSASGGAFRHWSSVRPFGVVSSSTYRAAEPFALTSRRYARDFNEVKQLGSVSSTQRPEERAAVAQIYAAQPPHIGWNSVARQLASVRHDDITETARTLALLNAALSDAFITVFESKYYYSYWRPETAIARADEVDNKRTNPDPAFAPFIVAPCFPSYPSGHGAGAGAGRTVLAQAYGEGPHALTNSTPSVPGVVLHYTRLRQIVRDVSDARVYGGIHFRHDQDAAEELGKRVASYDLEHLFRKVQRRDQGE
jgi:hypothetical protein